MKKCIRKLLCKLGYHDDELQRITIQPIYAHRKEEFFLPKPGGWMYKCMHCGNEKIERL